MWTVFYLRNAHLQRIKWSKVDVPNCIELILQEKPRVNALTIGPNVLKADPANLFIMLIHEENPFDFHPFV